MGNNYKIINVTNLTIADGTTGTTEVFTNDKFGPVEIIGQATQNVTVDIEASVSADFTNTVIIKNDDIMNIGGIYASGLIDRRFPFWRATVTNSSGTSTIAGFVFIGER